MIARFNGIELKALKEHLIDLIESPKELSEQEITSELEEIRKAMAVYDDDYYPRQSENVNDQALISAFETALKSLKEKSDLGGAYNNIEDYKKAVDAFNKEYREKIAKATTPAEKKLLLQEMIAKAQEIQATVSSEYE